MFRLESPLIIVTTAIVATTTVNNKLQDFFTSPEFIALVAGSSIGFVINEVRQIKQKGEDNAMEAHRLKCAGELGRITEAAIKAAILEVEHRSTQRINDLKEDIHQVAEIAREAREIASEK